MKVIMLMFDSLNRNFLPSYGNDWIKADNFTRLAEHAVQFQNCYAGSLPCMPARRELHTGRYNFLHRSWGPLEPFDDSMPELLKNNGIFTHLISDHHLYWADGGATYHNRYSTWEIIRGQEGDPWKGFVEKVEAPKDAKAPQRLFLPSREKLSDIWDQEWKNRQFFKTEEDYPQSKTFDLGLEFIENNHEKENWFLQIESFDPHEPFLVPEEYDKLYEDKIKKRNLDWPDYHPVTENEEDRDNLKYKYAALLSKCDNSLGKVLDLMDKHKMWDNTMLIVCTDHGFLLGEHNWWAKNMMPAYNEIINTPLFIWDPRIGKKGEQRESLVQFIDLAPTILEFFGITPTKDMQGKILKDTLESDQKIRDFALIGWHGNQINCTDGRYVYMRGPETLENSPLFEYTLMPTHIKSRFSIDELKDAEFVKGFNFTKGCNVLKIPVKGFNQHFRFGTRLYDISKDPKQSNILKDYEIEKYMLQGMKKIMIESEAPIEQYERVGIPLDSEITTDDILKHHKKIKSYYALSDTLEKMVWEEQSKEEFFAFINLMSTENRDELIKIFEMEVEAKKTIHKAFVRNFIQNNVSEEKKSMVLYFLNLLSKRD
ncbi:MAG: sulfatase [Cetobacterium sp.]|uniref:sulfatase n=1 Tax=Cetobacterium sp. TaxID=2071632 RepID=UPI002FC625C0